MTRSVLLGLAVRGVLATVAAGPWLRKPELPAVARPLVEPAQSVQLRGPEALMPTEPPKPLPDFSFQDASGATHTMAEFRGRAVVLNLWATWCQPCIAELPALAALARRAPGDGISVIALSTDRGGASTVRRFLAAHGLDLPIWVDPPGQSGEVLAVRGLPTTLLIDRDGRERGRLEGAIDWTSAAVQQAIVTATRMP